MDRDEGQHSKVYYYMLPQYGDKSFYVDKIDGSIYTNKSFDREEKDEYDIYIFATKIPDYYISNEEQDVTTLSNVLYNASIAKVRVVINDLNDNAPKFEEPVYYTAVNTMADLNEFIANVTAIDPDFGVNGSLTYYIKASNLYKYGYSKSSGSIIPSPFNITQDGQLIAATNLAENNQNRFIVDVVAKENAFPGRETVAKVHVSVE